MIVLQSLFITVYQNVLYIEILLLRLVLEESLTPLAEPEILETMSVQSSTNWTEAFGFPSDNDAQDDDLGQYF